MMEKINANGKCRIVLYSKVQVLMNFTGRDCPTMRGLVQHVLPSVATRWYDLGLQLLDPQLENELKIIESDTRNDSKECCRKMFNKWLETDELASWNKLVAALKCIKLNSFASNLNSLLLQGN